MALFDCMTNNCTKYEISVWGIVTYTALPSMKYRYFLYLRQVCILQSYLMKHLCLLLAYQYVPNDKTNLSGRLLPGSQSRDLTHFVLNWLVLFPNVISLYTWLWFDCIRRYIIHINLLITNCHTKLNAPLSSTRTYLNYSHRLNVEKW